MRRSRTSDGENLRQRSKRNKNEKKWGCNRRIMNDSLFKIKGYGLFRQNILKKK